MIFRRTYVNTHSRSMSTHKSLLELIQKGLVFYAVHGEVHSTTMCTIELYCFTSCSLYPKEILYGINNILERLREGIDKKIRMMFVKSAIIKLLECFVDYPDAIQSFRELQNSLEQKIESLEREAAEDVEIEPEEDEDDDEES